VALWTDHRKEGVLWTGHGKEGSTTVALLDAFSLCQYLQVGDIRENRLILGRRSLNLRDTAGIASRSSTFDLGCVSDASLAAI
jgi:hypothetical protein